LQDRYHLTIVWTHNLLAGEIGEQVKALGIQDRVHFLTRASDDELILLYNAASLFVFPSRYEGFGLPPLEAMACGAPVMSADNSSLPEITGGAALLFNAEDVAAITEGMAKVLSDPGLQQSLSQKGQLRAAQFSWAKCGLETLAVYRLVGA
jgi:glycosyltransferase involved in cell wall biosynthesis